MTTYSSWDATPDVTSALVCVCFCFQMSHNEPVLSTSIENSLAEATGIGTRRLQGWSRAGTGQGWGRAQSEGHACACRGASDAQALSGHLLSLASVRSENAPSS